MLKQKPKILLVEDDQLLAELTSFRLELLDYEVVVEHDCERAFDTISDNHFDLVIIDLEMHGIGGLELINRLQDSNTIEATRILATSIDADLDVVQRAYEAGAMDYLVTPYDPMILEQKIENLLHKPVTV
ncbi:MAG: two-component system response regulator [Blastopirellula sp.]|nr:MAG: two-component system response regulator [Blastopirellula sp.]